MAALIPGDTGTQAWQQGVAGPFLSFHDYNPATQEWRGSVLLVATQPAVSTTPVLHVQSGSGAQASTQCMLLDSFQGWNFWRGDLLVVAGPQEQRVTYWLVFDGAQGQSGTQQCTFFVPGAQQPWNWGFYSCNGFHEASNEAETGGIGPMWQDVLATHRQQPLHLMVGGGDQLYNDPVWKTPALDAFVQSKPDNWQDAPYAPDMHEQVQSYYFNSYLKHWGQPGFREALATIPQIMTCDDHDVFDGWGSYPTQLHNSAIFQGVFNTARHFYALFQQHSPPNGGPYRLNGAFGAAGGWHSLTCLGPSLALLMLDCRMERDHDHIVHPDSYPLIQARLMTLPPSVRHVAVVASVPLIYPEIPTSEGIMGFLSNGWFGGQFNVAHLMQKTGLCEGLINQFGSVDLLDDVQDHWGSGLRRDEKARLVRMLQGVSAARGMRFTLLGGDVHLACVGRFASKSGLRPEEDHRFIPQLTSSAMGNVPPPSALVKVLSTVDSRLDLDNETEEYLVTDVFDGDMLMPSRNWLKMNERPRWQGGDDSVLCLFRVENADYRGMRDAIYQCTIPALLPGCGQGITPLTCPEVYPPRMAFDNPTAVLRAY